MHSIILKDKNGETIFEIESKSTVPMTAENPEARFHAIMETNSILGSLYLHKHLQYGEFAEAEYKSGDKTLFRFTEKDMLAELDKIIHNPESSWLSQGKDSIEGQKQTLKVLFTSEKTPMDYAAEGADPEIVKILRENGAKETAKSTGKPGDPGGKHR